MDQKRTIIKKLHFGLLDQITISGSNFLISLLLARILHRSDYGYFIIALSTLMILLGLQNAFLSRPVSVLGSVLEKENWASFYRSTLILQLGLSAFITLVIILAIPIIGLYKSYPDRYLLLLFSFVAFFFIFQEFFRRTLITRLDYRNAFYNDLTVFILRLFFIGFFYSYDIINICTVLFAFLISCAAGTFIGYFQVNIFRPKFEYNRDHANEIFKYGKWTVADWIPLISSGYLYIYIISFVLSSEVVAAFGACRVLISPLVTAMTAIVGFGLPPASKLYSQGKRETFNKMIITVFRWGLACMALYCFLVSFFSEELLAFLYKGKYNGYGAVVSFFCIYIFLNFLSKPAEFFLYVDKKPKAIFMVRLCVCIINIIICYPLVNSYGIYGGNFGYIIGQVLMLSGLMYIVLLKKSATTMKEN